MQAVSILHPLGWERLGCRLAQFWFIGLWKYFRPYHNSITQRYIHNGFGFECPWNFQIANLPKIYIPMQKITSLAFFILLMLCFTGTTANPAGVLVRNHNIFAVMANGNEIQLTFSRTDRDPILIPGTDQVVFVRGEVVRTGFGSYTRNKIMMLDAATLKKRIVTEEKPYLDGLEDTHEIIHVIAPTLSPDNRHLYFITEKYATSNQLVKVHLQTGDWTEMFAAESFELINTGRLRGFYLISRSEIGDRGRDLYYRIVDRNNRTIQRFDSRESATQFILNQR